MQQAGRCASDNVLVILNPTARHGLAARLEPALATATEAHPGWTLSVTTCPGDATRLAALAAGRDMVIVAGGDGTVHEVVNGLLQLERGRRPALAMIPAGSGDDYSRMLGIQGDAATCLSIAEAGRTRQLDAGTCDGVAFMNSFSLGLDARVTAYVTELQKSTRQTGLPLYARGLAHILFRDYRTHELTVVGDGAEPLQVQVLLLAAGIGPTYGGGFKILPCAVPDDGLLDVIAIAAVPLAEAMWRLPFVVTGHHLGMKPVTFTRARSLSIASVEPILGQLDGEVIEARRFDIECLPSALEVVVP